LEITLLKRVTRCNRITSAATTNLRVCILPGAVYLRPLRCSGGTLDRVRYGPEDHCVTHCGVGTCRPIFTFVALLSSCARIYSCREQARDPLVRQFGGAKMVPGRFEYLRLAILG